MPAAEKKHRIQMDVGPKTLARLNFLKEELEVSSYAEVIRLSLTALEEKHGFNAR